MERKIPNHVGVILDGNRRFARKNYLDHLSGHNFGAKKLERFLKWCWQLDIKIVTVWGFSTENFNRAEDEVNHLMKLFLKYLKKLQTEPMIKKYKIKVKIIGQLQRLSQEHNEEIKKLENLTKDNNRCQLNIALCYGGRAEIVDAVKNIARKIENKELRIDDIDEKLLSNNLYTKGIPDPDLILRTSGEERLSGFMLWQGSYAELYFTDVFWPALRKIDFWRAIRTYQDRQRRFGK